MYTGNALIVYNAARSGTPSHPGGVPDPLAALLVAQAKHETGDFSSNAFRTGNNAFGYSYFPTSDWQKGPGLIADNGQPIATYSNVGDSTREIVDWIYRRVKEGVFPGDLSIITTPEQYAVLLKKAGFYGDSVTNYTNGLIRYFVKKKSEIAGGLLLLAGLALVWINRKKFGL